MTLALALGLIGLAAIDSTSIGTLYIPIWLMLAPGRVRAGRIMAYLGIVAGAYFLIGLAILLGADAAFTALGGAWERGGPLDTPLVNGAMVALGLAMLGYSVVPGRKAAGPSRLTRWRDRAVSTGTLGAVAGLGIVSVALELATMLPYLAAMALIAAADLGWTGRVAALAGYCLVMVAPALAILALRMKAEARIQPALVWFDGEVRKRGGSAVLWGVGIVGLVLAGFGGLRLIG